MKTKIIGLSLIISILFFGLLIGDAFLQVASAGSENYNYEISTAGGGDCQLIGNWDSGTNTCTLSGNVVGEKYGVIRFLSSGITLDCDGYRIDATGGAGIYYDGPDNIVIKNCVFENVVTWGIHARYSSPVTIYNNRFDADWNSEAIRCYECDNMNVSFNKISCNPSPTVIHDGMNIRGGVNSYFHDNDIRYCSTGMNMYSTFSNTYVFHNNFVDNIYEGYYSNLKCASGITFEMEGLGNYWSDFDTPAEGCSDTSPTDGVCDVPYTITPPWPTTCYDYHALVTEWEPQHYILVLSDNTWKSYDSLQPGWETPGFDDSGWRNAYAPYPQPAPWTPQVWIPGTNAVFMWDYPAYPPQEPDGFDGPDEAWFRKTFNLPYDPSYIANAYVTIGVDDDFDFYVNGTKVFSDWDGQVWSAPFTFNIKPYLVEGENVFALYGKDSFGIAEWALVDATIEIEGIECIEGDLNCDGCVDWTDLSIILADIRGPEPHDPSYDLNSDGAVNIADARYLVTLFTNPRGVACE